MLPSVLVADPWLVGNDKRLPGLRAALSAVHAGGWPLPLPKGRYRAFPAGAPGVEHSMSRAAGA